MTERSSTLISDEFLKDWKISSKGTSLQCRILGFVVVDGHRDGLVPSWILVDEILIIYYYPHSCEFRSRFKFKMSRRPVFRLSWSRSRLSRSRAQLLKVLVHIWFKFNIYSDSTDSAVTVTILHIALICYRNEPTETPIFTWWQEEQKKASPDCP